MTSRPAPVRLRAVEAAEAPQALGEALAGGPPFAPLPTDTRERAAALAMLRLDEPVDEADAAVVIATSGSTGQPKGVILSRSALLASATATHEALGGPGDWALALPVHYVAGLMVLVRARAAGTRAHPVGADLATLPQAVAAMSGRRYLAVVATQLARALPRPELVDALARFDAVLIGGGPLDVELREQATTAGVRVVSTYGMSETGGGCVSDGRPLPGVAVSLDPPTGRIRLRTPALFSGYRLRPDLTAAALVDAALVTQDRGRWSDDGRLEVLGRVDDVVISGGIKIDLAAVERACRAWAGDAEIAVLAVPDPTWGVTLVAVTDADRTVDDLRAGLADRLPRHAQPRRLVVRASLPHTAGGKIDRRQLLAELAAPGGPDGTPAAAAVVR